MKSPKSKIKQIKIGKHSGTTYCFWVQRLYEEF